jgi:hypothetical protein
LDTSDGLIVPSPDADAKIRPPAASATAKIHSPSTRTGRRSLSGLRFHSRNNRLPSHLHGRRRHSCLTGTIVPAERHCRHAASGPMLVGVVAEAPDPASAPSSRPGRAGTLYAQATAAAELGKSVPNSPNSPEDRHISEAHTGPVIPAFFFSRHNHFFRRAPQSLSAPWLYANLNADMIGGQDSSYV